MNTKVLKPEDPSKAEVRRRIELWIGIVGGPVLWLMQFQAIYSVAGWGCALQSKLPLYLTSTIFLLLVVCIGATAMRHLNPDGPYEDVRWVRFMARVGVMSSALSLLVIISQAIATIMLSQCME